MTDEPESHTLRLLREMRSEMREGFEKAFGDLAELRGSVSELRGLLAIGYTHRRRSKSEHGIADP